MKANPTDETRQTSHTLADLEKIKSQGKHGTATINLATGEITHSFSDDCPPVTQNGPQGLGIYDPDTGKVEREFFFGNVPKPVRGEVYRWHSEFDPYIMYYVEYKAWLTTIQDKMHCIVCPGFDFRHKDRTRFNLYVVKQSVRHPITPRLGIIFDDDERSIAKAMIKLAHKAWPVSTRGQFQLTKDGLAGPGAIVDFKGVDKWRVAACAMWWRWQTDSVTWEARAAEIRQHFPNKKHPMTAKRLQVECGRMGLRK